MVVQQTHQHDYNLEDMSELELRHLAERLLASNRDLSLDCENENRTVVQLRKQVNDLESERANFSTQYTDEICELRAQKAANDSRIQELEADKHRHQFELIQLQQSSNSEISRRDARINSIKEKLHDLQRKVDEVESQREAAIENVEQLRQQFAEKESGLNSKVECLSAEKEIAITERSVLSQKINELENLTADLQSKISQMSKENESLEVSAKQSKSEFDAQIEASDQKRIETEARLDELATCLQREKSEKDRANNKVDVLSKQLTEMIQTYDTTKNENHDLWMKLSTMESERDQLRADLTTSQAQATSLRSQLDDYENNFLGIKSELTTALKRQREFEDMYGHSFKDLEAVLMQHGSTGAFSTNGSSSRKASSRRKKAAKAHEDEALQQELMKPIEVVESVSSLLADYNAQVQAARSENGALVDRLKSVSAECNSYKEAIDHGRQQLNDVKEQLVAKSHDLTKVKRERLELEQRLGASAEEIKRLQDGLEKQRQRADRLSDNMLVFKKKAKIDEDNKKKVLTTVYARMLTGRVILDSLPGVQSDSAENKVNDMMEFEQLSEAVLSQLEKMNCNFKNVIEKLRNAEFACARKDEALDSVHSQHETALANLRAEMTHREHTFCTQKTQLEEHYSSLVDDLQAKIKNSQRWASEVAEKANTLENLRTAHEIEIAELKELLSKVQTNQRAFQVALCLTCSALFPLLERQKALSSQQRLLLHYYAQSQLLVNQVNRLASALHSANPGQSDAESDGIEEGGKCLAPILRFRKCVVAVLAANRLVRISNQSKLCFTTQDVYGSECRVSLYIGGSSGGSVSSNERPKPKNSTKKGASQWLTPRDPRERVTEQQDTMLHWLTDAGFSHKVLTSVGDLTQIVENNLLEQEGLTGEQQQQPKKVPVRGILTSARNTFIQLMSRTSQHFEGMTPLVDGNTALRERPSLAQQLLKGLHAAMMRLPPALRARYVPAQHSLRFVHSAVLELSESVSGLEGQRRQLQAEVASLRTENCQLAGVRENMLSLQDQLHQLKKQSEGMVSREKYGKVRGELDSALLREQQAEQLLKEQGEQLLAYGRQLEATHRDESSRELSLAQSARELCEAKLQLNRRTQEVRSLARQLEQVSLDREAKLHNSFNGDSPASNRESEIVSKYARAVTAAVENFKNQILYSGQVNDSLSIPNLDEMLVCREQRRSEQLLACQGLVMSFAEAVGVVTTQLHTHINQVVSQRNHIAALKQQLLSAAAANSTSGGPNVVWSSPSVSGGGTPTPAGEGHDSDYGTYSGGGATNSSSRPVSSSTDRLQSRGHHPDLAHTPTRHSGDRSEGHDLVPIRDSWSSSQTQPSPAPGPASRGSTPASSKKKPSTAKSTPPSRKK